MTEQEWLACTDEDALWAPLRGNVGDRKARLFGCACCRLLCPGEPSAVIQRALRAAEGFADDLMAWEELARIEKEVLSEIRGTDDLAEMLAVWCMHPDGHKALRKAA
jgi:hypothetical protein